MSYNVAILKAMQAEGLDLSACIRVLEAGEKRADPTAAERKRRQRAKSQRDVTRDPLNDNILNPGSEAKASSPKFPAPDGVEERTWADFLASPKRRKAGMNATAYAGIASNLKILAENGFPPGEMVALAVERGWTTIKLEWVQNDGRSQQHPNIGKTTAAIAGLGGFNDDRPM